MSAIPTDVPDPQPLARRADLVRQIKELEGAVQYMGSAHPRRAEMHQRLEGFKALLTRWDQAETLQSLHAK